MLEDTRTVHHRIVRDALNVQQARAVSVRQRCASATQTDRLAAGLRALSHV